MVSTSVPRSVLVLDGLQRKRKEMTPIAQIFQITNGFLVSFKDPNAMVGDAQDMTYAADARELGEAIIAAAARKKLDVEQHVPVQKEMFTPAQMGTTKGVS